MESCVQPCDLSSSPSAWTAGNPPSRSRMRPAMRRAIDKSVVESWMLKAMRNGRTPTAVAPAVGCGLAGPNQAYGLAHASQYRAPRTRDAAGPRGCARDVAPLDRRDRPATHSEQRSGRRTRRAPCTHCSMVVSPRGMKGIDIDGADPGVLSALRAHVDAFDSHTHGRLHRRHHGTRVARQREHAPDVIDIGGSIEEPRSAVLRDHSGNSIECRDIVRDTQIGDAFDEGLHTPMLSQGRRRSRC